MGATTIGAMVGAAIDGMSGDDGVADGAVIGAVTANVLKVVLPLAITVLAVQNGQGFAVLTTPDFWIDAAKRRAGSSREWGDCADRGD